MRIIIVIAALLVFFGGSSQGTASTLFSVPFILVTPRVVDFGVVPSGKMATNTFVVENIGSGKLVGAASVAPPFRIISGGDYELKYGSAQVITVVYSPEVPGTNEQIMRFSGGLGAKIPMVGKAVPVRATLWRSDH